MKLFYLPEQLKLFELSRDLLALLLQFLESFRVALAASRCELFLQLSEFFLQLPCLFIEIPAFTVFVFVLLQALQLLPEFLRLTLQPLGLLKIFFRDFFPAGLLCLFSQAMEPEGLSFLLENLELQGTLLLLPLQLVELLLDFLQTLFYMFYFFLELPLFVIFFFIVVFLFPLALFFLLFFLAGRFSAQRGEAVFSTGLRAGIQGEIAQEDGDYNNKKPGEDSKLGNHGELSFNERYECEQRPTPGLRRLFRRHFTPGGHGPHQKN